MPLILAHVPANAASNQLFHYGQIIKSNHFRQYDYGAIRNYIKYRRFSPPDYNLKNIRTPIAVYYSENDWMVSPKNISTLFDNVPNVVKKYLVPHKQFNHIGMRSKERNLFFYRCHINDLL